MEIAVVVVIILAAVAWAARHLYRITGNETGCGGCGSCGTGSCNGTTNRSCMNNTDRKDQPE